MLFNACHRGLMNLDFGLTCISLESWPVYTTIPTTHCVFLSWAPRRSTWSGPRGAGLQKTSQILQIGVLMHSREVSLKKNSFNAVFTRNDYWAIKGARVSYFWFSSRSVPVKSYKCRLGPSHSRRPKRFMRSSRVCAEAVSGRPWRHQAAEKHD